MNHLTTFNGFNSLLDNFFDDFGGLSRHQVRGERSVAPKIEIKKSESEYKVFAELPGVKQDDLKVEVNKGYLNISAKTEGKEENEIETVHSEFYSYAEFKRSLKLDESAVDTENVVAKLENGVLEITLPIKEAVKPRQIEVK